MKQEADLLAVPLVDRLNDDGAVDVVVVQCFLDLSPFLVGEAGKEPAGVTADPLLPLLLVLKVFEKSHRYL